MSKTYTTKVIRENAELDVDFNNSLRVEFFHPIHVSFMSISLLGALVCEDLKIDFSKVCIAKVSKFALELSYD